MEKQLFQNIITQLEKLRNIYEIVQVPKKDVREVNKIIESIQQLGMLTNAELTPTKSSSNRKNTMSPHKKSQSFAEVMELLFENKYHDIGGTKIDYKKMTSPEHIVDYFEATTKSKVMKNATALDLKLLYCLLIQEKRELKGNKNEVYSVIKNNIRARKRGEAFRKM